MVSIREFTDPTCPWACSAEPTLFRLRWLYGDALRWERRMIVLSERPEDFLERGSDPPRQSRTLAMIRDRYGMPMATDLAPRMHATVHPCRAVVAARVHAPEREAALLRRLRVLRMSGEMVDEPAVIARAAAEAGIDPEALARWMDDPRVEAALREDMELARAPSAPARAMPHKLADATDGRLRYTAPSLEITGPEGRIDIAGFNPTAVYEHAIANVAPQAPRRAGPADVAEVLRWAGEPMATIEVAETIDRPADRVRAELAEAGAVLTPVAQDGYWTLP